ncbi:anhydro-N-acetylmuramic acid kinase [Noviherbaspirillum sedimenti]|uniref:Anhydro-N-acetylmuramic acid kinase n=1 Tax=Noviherbaspirillum sedimenti TaxID=2320865 RepID=A0A3A3GPY4_9BURK|nr:anhydro-N-acetylmuramic acid kinase [Noviherbaspirillum sedimenti]RJG04386.1 anhydro-N-acetylmuramic acid kinase [Noviherbaspirillum sedimenti]
MPPQASSSSLYIGLMSGTSLDGADGVLAAFPADYRGGPIETLASAYIAFPPELRRDMLALQAAGNDEIHREALLANTLASHYAACVVSLLTQAGVAPRQVAAIGVHGQTIRHRPELGYTRQTNNPALLAELTGIDVVADFRSRDIAAGGQGAPLVPAFHQAVFAAADTVRVVANIGGISNISVLPPRSGDANPVMPSAPGTPGIIGFDTGPGNVLMDAWIGLHQGLAYDSNGDWASSGRVLPTLLDALRDEAFFSLVPPKSTGRDLFHLEWLRQKLAAAEMTGTTPPPQDVQATLASFTATTLADAIASHAPGAAAVYICGGGACNAHLLLQLQSALAQHHMHIAVDSTAALGMPPNHVEALAFAWLAQRFCLRQPGNLPAVTGARGDRILGALYPA